ncbi:uncharacterized protein LOC106063203 [Biomphalaria glabrata]|uniref:Uncharacterized protein LOC106063203 n=1 Tax=Biomphalaria glabrata TaxID=6526 RepID=A0A9U8E7T1_BIOGL|nr:uncharacterized protein LOC106063203 [Biomphalaria glabrata]
MMADISNSFRSSSIYEKPEMEGYLEKKNSGMMKGKTKKWCYIQGTSLYMTKNQGVVEILDLCDAQQVKKISSDSTLTSFEIVIKKKSHIFICQTSDECSQWIKALHNAMAKKDNKLRGSTFFVDDPVKNETQYESIYATIPNDEKSEPNENKTGSVYNVSDYTSPCDDVKEKCNGEVPVYYDIQSGSVLPVFPTTKNSIYEEISSTSTVKLQNEHETELYSDGYSQVNKCKLSPNDEVAILRSSKSLPVSCSRQTVTVTDETVTDQTNANNAKRYSNAKFDSMTAVSLINSDIKSDSKPAIVSQQTELETVSSDPFNMLVAALNIEELPLPEFNHPLTEMDRLPVKELTEFLASHNSLCHVHYSEIINEEDPFINLVSFLKDLSI